MTALLAGLLMLGTQGEGGVIIPRFDPKSPVQLRGNALLYAGTVRLTTAVPDRVGAVYLPEPRKIGGDFLIAFDFKIADGGGTADPKRDTGGDSLALVFHNDPRGTNALGAPPVAYGTIKPSVAIEFDTWFNGKPLDTTFPIAFAGDPDGNHISVHVDGSFSEVTNSLGCTGLNGVAPLEPNLSDGRIHHAEVKHQGGNLLISIDRKEVLRISNVDLAKRVGGQSAFIGLMAATGAAYETHDIYNLSIRNLLNP